jgi:prephenate dehydrogenase
MIAAILGVGMMGASVASALRRRQLASRVVGFDRDRAACERALSLGTIDAIAPDAAQAVLNADLVVLAVPVGAMPALFV